MVLYTSNRTETRDRLVALGPMSKDSAGSFLIQVLFRTIPETDSRMWLLCDQPLRQVPLVPVLSVSAMASLNKPRCALSELRFVQNLWAGGQDIWFGKASVSHGNLIH